MDARHTLNALLGAERLAGGVAALERLHARWRDLCSGTLRRGPAEFDEDYAQYHLYYLVPSLEAIAADGWVERHLRDFALLATSPSLAPCCRRTVVDLFGFEAFHVAVQFNSCSDDLVRKICHDPGDVRDHVRQIARDVMHYSIANGTYPPPGRSAPGRMYTATWSSVLDLGDWPTR